MNRILGKSLIRLGIVVLLLVGIAAYFLFAEVAPIGAGYKAKMLCSYLFVSKREIGPVLASDLEPFNPLLGFVEVEVDDEGRSVTATAFRLVERRAVFNPCLGCTVVPPPWNRDELRFPPACVDPEPGDPGSVPWPNANPHALWRIIRDTVGGGERDYLTFPRRALFNKIGMRSALIEPDPYGNSIGTSFGWATARDWARFGLLYLNGGIWEGERILPEGWVDYTTTPAPAAKYKHYGALFWLNAGANEFAKTAEERRNYPDKPPFPGIPADAYFAMGHDGQLVAIIPSRELVLVRLGLSRSSQARDYEGLLANILAAIGGSSRDS